MSDYDYSDADDAIVLEMELAEATQRITELERHNQLLWAVALAADSYLSGDINNSNLMDNLQNTLENKLLTAIDGGALDGEK